MDVFNARLSESDDDIDNDEFEHQEEENSNERSRTQRTQAPSSESTGATTLTVAQRQSIINKALTKIPSPGRFSGKDEEGQRQLRELVQADDLSCPAMDTPFISDTAFTSESSDLDQDMVGQTLCTVW